MSDELAFLRTIAANPDDDVSRLVFADWLDEHDQSERAEFIRAQIELATLSESNLRRLVSADFGSPRRRASPHSRAGIRSLKPRIIPNGMNFKNHSTSC